MAGDDAEPFVARAVLRRAGGDRAGVHVPRPRRLGRCRRVGDGDLARAGQSGLSGHRLEHASDFLRGDALVHRAGASVRVCDRADEQAVAGDRRRGDYAAVLDEFRRPRLRVEDDAAPGRLAAGVLSRSAEDPRVALRLAARLRAAVLHLDRDGVRRPGRSRDVDDY